MENDFAAIVLAAGIGKRMKSSLPKVLHQIAGRPMLVRTLEVLNQARPRQVIIVASPQNIDLIKKQIGNKYGFAIQKSPLGTADAASAGLKKINPGTKTVAVIYGDDTAFYKPETIVKVFTFHQGTKSKMTFVTVKVKNPRGLGRIIRENGKLAGIIEEKDATDVQKKIREVNDGLYFFGKNWLRENISQLRPSPVTKELYLTDLITIALKNQVPAQSYELKDLHQWHSVNTPKELEAANRKVGKRIHIMGIAGAGAAATAGIAHAYGYQVTGCDLTPASLYTKNLNLKIEKGHNPKHLKNMDMLVISPAVLKFNQRNKEVLAARKIKTPTFTWQRFQGRFLQKDKFVIAIAGCYGKSTTTAMISQILTDAGLDPTCEIGANVIAWGETNYRAGKSSYYVCEADEYNNNFLNYDPDVAIILNVGWDHPDFFKSKEAVFTSYEKFIGKVKRGGTLVIPDVARLNKLASYVHPSVKVVKITDFGKLNLSIIGNFRRQNANAGLTVAEILGLDLAKARKSIENFTGLSRRLEYKGQIGKTKVYDDYAVQPYTVKVTTDVLKNRFKNKKVILVFEPHTFSRIETFFGDFVSTLKNTKVDRVLITNVYPARERGDKTQLALKLAKKIGDKAKYTGSLEETASYLKDHLIDFDAILSMGAGDSYKLYDLLKQ